MNLADYLSELLGQRDEVNVPGLGYFVRTRVNASYNDDEARFYPPYHQVKFIPQPKDDEYFAQYVADKKNISLASSKYFVEKFINKLKEDAEKGKFLFADLGSFQTEREQLVFKANDRIPADPAFYGYPPVDITRPGQPLSAEQKKPVFVPSPQPAPAPIPAQVASPVADAAPAPVTAAVPDHYYEEETERKKGSRVWLILVLILAVLGLAAFGVYKLYPGVFDKVGAMFHKDTVKTVFRVKHHHMVVDTVKKTTVSKDSIAKAAAEAATADSLKKLRFEAIVYETRYVQPANEKAAQLKAEGYNAYVALDVPGPLIKVSAGAFQTYAQADSAAEALFKAGKIKKHFHPIEITKLK